MMWFITVVRKMVAQWRLTTPPGLLVLDNLGTQVRVTFSYFEGIYEMSNVSTIICQRVVEILRHFESVHQVWHWIDRKSWVFCQKSKYRINLCELRATIVFLTFGKTMLNIFFTFQMIHLNPRSGLPVQSLLAQIYLYVPLSWTGFFYYCVN